VGKLLKDIVVALGMVIERKVNTNHSYSSDKQIANAVRDENAFIAAVIFLCKYQ